jgi:hypothetical protein
MGQAFEPASDFKTLSLMPTYRCTASCQQCGTLSSPRDDTWLSRDAIMRAIDQAATAGYGLVVFTGGEATLAEEVVIEGVARSRSLGMRTRLVTNAWWAVDGAATTAALRKYQDAGLQELNVSTGDQHARFVSIDRPIRAAITAAELGFDSALIMVEVRDGNGIGRAAIEGHALMTDAPPAIRQRVLIMESPWMPLSPSRHYRYPEGLAANRENLESRGGCDNILSTTTVQADGRIAACCGLGMRVIPELQIGSVDATTIAEAAEIANEDFLKRWIRIEGPEKILAWAADFDPSIEWEDQYAHRCQACRRVYADDRVKAVIREHHGAKIPDILLREWLLSSPAIGADGP